MKASLQPDRMICWVDDVRQWPPVTDEGTNDFTDYLWK